jgi:hypothetical protein
MTTFSSTDGLSPSTLLRQANREVSAGGWHRDHRLYEAPPAQGWRPNPDASLASVSFTEIDPGGPFMTVKLEPPRLNRIGSLHALTLTREERPNAVVGDIPALPVNPISATS